MFLLVGLGNPGPDYEHTPHNAGFRALDEFVRKMGLEWQTKFSSYLTECRLRIKGEPIAHAVLIKPQLFMNRSGMAVTEVLRFLKIKTHDLWVIHDELDLPLGRLKITCDRSAAGHKGVQSIIAILGTQKFYRFRIGVMPPEKPNLPDEYLTNRSVAPELEAQFNEGISQAAAALESALRQGIVKARTEFNATVM